MLFHVIIKVLELGLVYAGVQHYTKHHCIAIAAVSALLYMTK